ncbi:MAG: outer membrane beta-barrel protein [Vicinamibacterales bacterium]
MSIRTWRRAAAAAAAWACVSLALPCAGQSPDPPPPGTLTFGPLRISPHLLVKDVGVDSNVFNAPVDPKHDFTMTVTPTADLLLAVRRIRLGYTSTVDYVYYRDYASERGVNSSSSARLDIDFGFLKPYVAATGVNAKTRLNTEVDERARHRDVTYTTGVALDVGSRTSLVLNGTLEKISYERDEAFRGVLLGRAFDGRRRAVDGGLKLALTPLTTFSLIVSREEQRFVEAPGRDSDSWRVSPGFAFDPGGLLNGSASIGYRRFKTRSPQLPDFTGLVSTATVVARAGRHEAQGVFRRDVQYSYDVATSYYLATGGTLTWTVLLFGPVDVRGTAGRMLMDYNVSGLALGTDKTSSYGAGVGYRFSNRARLGINAEWSRRDSDRAFERRFRNHRIFAGFSWGITS